MPPQSLLIQLATTAADVEFNAHNAECGCLSEPDADRLGLRVRLDTRAPELLADPGLFEATEGQSAQLAPVYFDNARVDGVS